MHEETDVLIVFCTFPEQKVARQIGTVLVERQLAACVNLVPGIESLYRWQDELKCDPEVLAVIKTTSDAYPDLEATLRELHPYEVAEVLALPVTVGSPPFLAWVAAQTGT